MQHGGRPGDVPAPAVPDENRTALTEGLDDTGHVLTQGDGVVPAWGLVRAAVTAHVHGHRPVARGGEGRELCAPGPPELREAVQQQDHGTTRRSGLHDME